MAVVMPGLELGCWIVGVDIEDGAAKIDSAVDEQKVIGDVFGFGGDTRDGIDDLAEELGVGAKKHIGIMPDVIAVFAGGYAAEGGTGPEEVDCATGAVEAAFEGWAGEAAFELMAEGIQASNMFAVEDTDFGVALGGEEVGEGDGELRAKLWGICPSGEMTFVEHLRNVGLPV